MLKGPREKTHYSNSEYSLQISRNFYLVTVEPEDERRLLVTVVDLARQVEHAADVDKHLAVAQDPGRWHCKRERERVKWCRRSFYYSRGKRPQNCQNVSDNCKLNATLAARRNSRIESMLFLKLIEARVGGAKTI